MEVHLAQDSRSGFDFNRAHSGTTSGFGDAQSGGGGRGSGYGGRASSSDATCGTRHEHELGGLNTPGPLLGDARHRAKQMLAQKVEENALGRLFTESSEMIRRERWRFLDLFGAYITGDTEAHLTSASSALKRGGEVLKLKPRAARVIKPALDECQILANRWLEAEGCIPFRPVFTSAGIMSFVVCDPHSTSTRHEINIALGGRTCAHVREVSALSYLGEDSEAMRVFRQEMAAIDMREKKIRAEKAREKQRRRQEATRRGGGHAASYSGAGPTSADGAERVWREGHDYDEEGCCCCNDERCGDDEDGLHTCGRRGPLDMSADELLSSSRRANGRDGGTLKSCLERIDESIPLAKRLAYDRFLRLAEASSSGMATDMGIAHLFRSSAEDGTCESFACADDVWVYVPKSAQVSMNPESAGLLQSPIDACLHRFRQYEEILRYYHANSRRAISGEMLLERPPAVNGAQILAREDQLLAQAQNEAQRERLQQDANAAAAVDGLLTRASDSVRAIEAARAHAIAHDRQITRANEAFERKRMDRANVDDLRAAGVSETLISNPLQLDELLAQENARRDQLAALRSRSENMGIRVYEAPTNMKFSAVKPSAPGGLFSADLEAAYKSLEDYVRDHYGSSSVTSGNSTLASVAQTQERHALFINSRVTRISEFLTFVTRSLYGTVGRFEGRPDAFARFLARLISPGASALIHFFMVAIRISESCAFSGDVGEYSSVSDVELITQRISNLGRKMDSSSVFKNNGRGRRGSTAWDLTTQALLGQGFGDFVSRSLSGIPAAYLDAAVKVFLDEENSGLKHLDSIGALLQLSQSLDLASFSLWEGHDRDAMRAARRAGKGRAKSDAKKLTWLEFLLQKVGEAATALEEEGGGSDSDGDDDSDSDFEEMVTTEDRSDDIYVEIPPYRSFLSIETVAQAHELGAISGAEGAELIRTKLYLPAAPGRAIKRVADTAPGGASSAQPAKKQKTSTNASNKKEASGGNNTAAAGKSAHEEKDAKDR